MSAYLAVDLGAETGRVMRGELVDGRLTVAEVHRFANVPVRREDGLHWDTTALFAGVSAGITAAGAHGPLSSIGIDTWGNDFGLLDRAGRLVAEPWHHRDPRTRAAVASVTDRVGAAELYRITGTPPLSITTASQLVAMEGSPLLAAADRLAMLPDLFGYWLTGHLVTEQTIASTSQLLDVTTRRWATGVMDRLGIPTRLFAGEVVAPGTPTGPVRKLPGVVVTAVAGHDTASAVAALPVESDAFAYVASGTWSLAGLELPGPVLTEAARLAGFSNEAGVGGTVRFLRNGTGLWLLQRCRAAWAGSSYAELVDAAATVPAFGALVDPDHPDFLAPPDMPAQLAARCRETGQPAPAGRAALVRCVLDSLACKHRWTIERAEALSGRTPSAVVHVVGGGAANSLLCQLVADVTGRQVLAGPVEATAIGNLLVQAWAAGAVSCLPEVRQVVRRSVEVRRYAPGPGAERAAAAYTRFLALLDV